MECLTARNIEVRRVKNNSVVLCTVLYICVCVARNICKKGLTNSISFNVHGSSVHMVYIYVKLLVR